MRTLSLLVLASLFFGLASCEEEPTNVEKYYEGTWTLQATDPQVDSIAQFFVNSDGNFSYQLNYGGAVQTVRGEVKNTGELRANIELDDIVLGISEGRLGIDGTGNGEYQIVSQTFQWTAIKQ